MQIQAIKRSSLPSLLVLVLAACSGGGGGGGGAGQAPANHAESLARLGVDQTESARIDEYGHVLPEDYRPLGGVVRLDPVTELWLGGVPLQGSDAIATLLEDVSGTPPAGDGRLSPAALFSLSEDDAPWMKEEVDEWSFPSTGRAAAAADLDGDGDEELVTIYRAEDRLEVLVVENVEGQYPSHEEVLLFNLPEVRDVSLAAGDFDGDHADDLAVGYVIDGEARIFFAGLDENGAISMHTGSLRVFDPYFSGSAMELVMESGNLDNDPLAELVVVVNERAGNTVNPMITSRFHVIDDRATDYREMNSGFVEGFELNQGLRIAGLADLALGDIDGDHRDEILFGGLEDLATNCASVPYVLIALDDAASGFVTMGVKTVPYDFSGCEEVDPHLVRSAHIQALDLDGDGLDEVQVDAMTFDDWSSAPAWTRMPDWELPDTAFFDQQDFNGWLDRSNVAFATGDYDGDGREDILMWRDSLQEVRVYGMDEAGEHVVLHGRIPTGLSAFDGQVNPVLVCVDTDKDAPVLEATPEKQFAFIEPTVLAVLAAPPARFGIGQNTDECKTTFGNSDSHGNEEQATVSFSFTGSVGLDADGGVVTQSEAKTKHSLSVKISGIASRSYEVKKTVSFTTGPNEDTVVFTTVPVDIYEYRVLSHPDRDVQVGEIFRIFLPREPIFLQVERGFYNANVVEGGLKIEDNVFRHVIGNSRSYPTRAEKDTQLVRYGGLELGPQSVGQGSGSTELEIEVSEEYGVGGALELGYEYECEATIVGIVLGIKVGASAEAEFQVKSGSSTTYTGSVGSIDGEHFLENRYSFGLFTHVQLDPVTGQEFEVINYWVE
jgi:hypothetical protein